MTPFSETVHKDLVDVLTGDPGHRKIEFAKALEECLRIADSRRTTIGREDNGNTARDTEQHSS